MKLSASRLRAARLVRGIARPLADLEEHVARTVGHPAVEIAVRIAIESPGTRIGRVSGDAGEFERLAVVIRGVAAAVADGDRVLFRHLIEVVDVERALVLHLGVVEEESLDPKSGGRLARSCAELVDDAGDGDELDLVWIADEDVIEQDRAGRVIVRIDEAGHDRHLFGVEALSLLADERLDVLGAAHGDEPAGLDGESSAQSA